MKKLWLGLLVTLMLTLFVAPAFAWEFKMGGQFEWRYRYFGRANGYQDLFGDMRFQDNPANVGLAAGTGPIGFAGPNFWRGYNGNNQAPMATNSWGASVRVVRGGFSYADCDGSEYDQRMTFTPELRVNNAIYFLINMDLAGIRQKYNHRDFQTNGPLDRWYQDRVSQNAFDTAMIPSINQFKLVTKLPWGIVTFGTKDFPFGVGALLAQNTRATALSMVIPYGPFVFWPMIWNSRNPEGYGAFVPYTSTGPAANSILSMDNGPHNTIFWAILYYYRNGPVDVGGALFQKLVHLSSADGGGGNRSIYYNLLLPTPTAMYQYGTQDTAVFVGQMYGKYNNGRFFANAEYDWETVDNTYGGVGIPTKSNISGAPPSYTEASEFFGEAGALCGPAKLAFMFAWSGGPALNNGNPTKAYNGLAVNNQATDAYNYIMFHTYGGGNNAPWGAGSSLTTEENGMIVDGYALAARLDYAVAANLNVWGSYMWASRVEENGFLAGGINSNGMPGNGTAFAAQQWKRLNMPGAGGNMNPYVDDAYLGWEADMGIDWKLLENMSVMTRYAYWQPGPWFDQAYQVVGMNPQTGQASAATFMQGRSAIQSFSSSIMIDF